MSTMDRTKTTLFQIGLLFLLAVIAVGIWFNRFSAPAPKAGATVAGENLSQGSPFPSSPTALNNIVLPEMAQLISAIQRGDGKLIESTWRDALRQRNSKYLIELYRAICKHGNQAALEAIGPMVLPLDENGRAELLAGLDDLMDRKQYAGVRFIVDKKNTSIGLFATGMKPWVMKEFNREPFDPGRFETAFNAVVVDGHQQISGYGPELIVASLTGSASRFEWMLNKCSELPNNGVIGAIPRIESMPNLINDATIERMLRIGSKLRHGYNLTGIFRLCLPHIKPEHSVLVREMMTKMQAGPELVNYVLSCNGSEIDLWLRDDLRLSQALFLKFEQALRPADFREKVEQFKPLAAQFNQLATKWPELDIFRIIAPNYVEQNEWLWNNGYRPNSNSPVVSSLYLAIRFKDRELLKQTLSREKNDLLVALNQGMPMNAKPGDTSSAPNFVPLLEVITNWDLEAVKLLVATGAHDWHTWKHESPLLLATRQKKLDIYRHLVDAGINWKDQDVATAGKLEDVDQTILKDVRQEESLAKRDSALSLLNKTVAENNIVELDKVLERFPYRDQFGNLPQRVEAQMTVVDAMATNWRHAPEIYSVMRSAVKYPQMFNRLLAEGFPVDSQTLMVIVQGGHTEVLQSALADLDVRNVIKTHLAMLKNGSRNHAEVQKLLNELDQEIAPLARPTNRPPAARR